MKRTFVAKNILITGGSQGIGRAIAVELASSGANLFLVARTLKNLKNVQNELKSSFPNIRVEICAADVTKKADVKRAVSVMLKKLGAIDGLINNAGSTFPQYFELTPLGEFERLMQVDYLGAVYFTKEVYPHLPEGSFISFTSSVVGFMGVFGFTSYAPPKFALLGFAESLQQEVEHRSINVSVLCPPDTETPGFAEEEKTKPYETRKLSESAKLMTAEEVARRYVKKLQKNRFIITTNFESALYYRLHGMMPGTVRLVMKQLVRAARRSKEKET